MKKKVVLKGQMCDICGCLIDDSTEKITVDGETVEMPEKRLKVSMGPPLFRCHDFMDSTHNIQGHNVLLCSRCAYRFKVMFVQWKTQCEKEGWQERERLKAKLYE